MDNIAVSDTGTNIKRFGGYLPLELNPGDSHYKSSANMDVLAFNSGKAAIYYAICESKVKTVHIPHYICQSVVQIAKRAGVAIKRYFIDEDFMPINVKTAENEMIIIVNYFGMSYERIKQIYRVYSNVIVDNTQAFFAEPLIQEKVYNVYSCKKFIGVADGGYLISKKINRQRFNNLDKDYSSRNMEFCLTNVEYGPECGYEKKNENDKRFIHDVYRMSEITMKILGGVDYKHIKEKRLDNFRVLHNELGAYNRLYFENKFVPYYYPLFYKRDIRRELIEKKVYAPTLWEELINDKFRGKLEKEFSQKLIFLPLDQRYCAEDMREIARRVRGCIEI